MTPTGSNQSFCMLTTTADSMSDIMVDQQPQQQNQQPECISVTLVFSEVTRQVLPLEAGKDFVDLLLCLLTLPIGCIVKLLSDASLLRSQESISAAERLGLSSEDGAKEASRDPSKGWGTAAPLSGISSVYDSVVKMEDSMLLVEKSVLPDSRPQIPACARLLPFAPLEEDMKEVNYFCCGVSCLFVSRDFGAKCPRHKRKMDTRGAPGRLEGRWWPLEGWAALKSHCRFHEGRDTLRGYQQPGHLPELGRQKPLEFEDDTVGTN